MTTSVTFAHGFTKSQTHSPFRKSKIKGTKARAKRKGPLNQCEIWLLTANTSISPLVLVTVGYLPFCTALLTFQKGRLHFKKTMLHSGKALLHPGKVCNVVSPNLTLQFQHRAIAF